MSDFLIGLAFVAMIVVPAVVAFAQHHGSHEGGGS